MVEIDQKSWEGYLTKLPHTPVLQSWAWGDFNTSLGTKVERLAIQARGQISSLAELLISRRRLGRYIYVPHGPVVNWQSGNAGAILAQIEAVGRREAVDYIRIEPRIARSVEVEQTLRRCGYRPAPVFVQAEVGWVLDLAGKNEDILLAGMRKTTRYLIRQAEKLGVEIKISRDPKDLPIFLKLLGKTAERQGFSPLTKHYLTKQFETLSKDGTERLFLASYQGEILAGALILFYGDTVSYVHGASVASKVPASYLLQWSAIKVALSEGRQIYDFWGIAPDDDSKHPWAGLTMFKQGFGGRRIDYISAWDKPLTARYRLIHWVEKIRRILSGI